MPVFVDPDELKSTSRLPDFEATPCNGLEALTGGDLCLSRLPILPSSANLKMHIDHGALFVQRKSGYDICSFDALKSSIARMKKCGIPIRQAILLPIGKYYPDKDGLLRIEGRRPFGETTYKTFRKLLALWGYRRGWVEPPLTSEDELPVWIEAQFETMDDVEKDPSRDFYRQQPKLRLEEEDGIFQDVVEIDDWRAMLVCGIPGLGEKTIENVREYLENHSLYWPNALHGLIVLANETQGKPIHNVPGWGEGRRRVLRELLSLPPGYNISVSQPDSPDPYSWGWNSALKHLAILMRDEKMSARDAWALLQKQILEFEKGEVLKNE